MVFQRHTILISYLDIVLAIVILPCVKSTAPDLQHYIQLQQIVI